jgi:4-hydroxybenzoate polyprenyltransferase
MPTPPTPAPRRELLYLVNPPLVVSAAAECLAGAYLGGAPLGSFKPYVLALSAALLFAAGSVFGHYFDRPNDETHHPERALPSGRLEPGRAWLLGWGLLLPGVLLTWCVGRESLATSIAVALAVVLYAAVAKGVWGWGFFTLAAARALNLVLGLTATEHGLLFFWKGAVPVLLYAAGWAVLRSSKQPGAPPASAFVALLHMAAGLSVFLYLDAALLDVKAFVVLLVPLFGFWVLPRVVRAVLDGRRPAVLEAVQWSFVGLTFLEMGLAGGSNGLPSGLIVGACSVAMYYALRKWPVTLALASR